MENATIGSRLRIWISQVYGSQWEAAMALAMQPSLLNRYLADRSSPSAETLTRLATVGCDITWLLTGTGDMFADNDAGRRLRALFDNGGMNHEGTSLTGPSTGYAKDLSSKGAPRSRGERSGKEQG